jgi:lipopolysaccharide biosynthesis protein
MADPDTPTIDDAARRQLAVDLFNHVWTLMGTPDRTPQQDAEMIHAAHASRHHWGEVGAPANFARGEWQVSRVYSVLDRGEPALVHARLCLNTCVEHGIGDFDTAYAHEAMARAHRVLGNEAESTAHAEQARRAAAGIADPEDREHAMEDIAELL